MDNPENRNAHASAWMKRGIALLNKNTISSLTSSLACFERAIELRRTLPLQENPWYRYVLAAGWMNRGDALTRLGATENLAEAVRSYDAALTVLHTLDLTSNPLFRKRLVIAWTNRGLTLQAQKTPRSLREALASFEKAITLLHDPSPIDFPERREILASALTNRSNALLASTSASPARARASAEEALALIAGREEHDLVAAETGLKARHILCRAIAEQLADPTIEIAREELITAATDAVEEGMKIARLWEARGEVRFRQLAGEIFRFGARAYQIHQSHFLAEFLLENLDPAQSHDSFPIDQPMHAAANEAIAHALGEIRRDAFGAIHTPHFDRFLKTLRQLRLAEARLQELRIAQSQ